MKNIQSIVAALNSSARDFQIGDLQALRTELKALKRCPGTQIFTAQSTFDHYAFHWGGRAELQFNVGFEGTKLRRGVASAFSTGRNVPDLSGFRVRVRRFNDYLDRHREQFREFTMWHYDADDARSKNYTPTPIPDDLVKNRVFVVLGCIEQASLFAPATILADFDRLLPLYLHVEATRPSSNKGKQPPSSHVPRQTWRPRKHSTTMSAQEAREIDLRHNRMQERLLQKLSKEFGKENVFAEHMTGFGGRIDIAVIKGERRRYYEIKTGTSARSCIREAIGQLLEYSNWPLGEPAESLVVVGPSRLDADGTAYLQTLRRRFRLSIEYECASS